MGAGCKITAANHLTAHRGTNVLDNPRLVSGLVNGLPTWQSRPAPSHACAQWRTADLVFTYRCGGSAGIVLERTHRLPI